MRWRAVSCAHRVFSLAVGFTHLLRLIHTGKHKLNALIGTNLVRLIKN